MIYTSYFAKQAKKVPNENTSYASIAVGYPHYELPFELKHVKSIKPYGVFGKYEGEEYVQKYFERLDRIGVDAITEEMIKAQGDKENLVLMCYEKNASECHRRMFAQWWFCRTGEIIEEMS